MSERQYSVRYRYGDGTWSRWARIIDEELLREEWDYWFRAWVGDPGNAEVEFGDGDVEYVRADLLAKLERILAAARKAAESEYEEGLQCHCRACRFLRCAALEVES